MKTKISVFNLHIVIGLKSKIVETGLKAKTIVFNIFLLSYFSLGFNRKKFIIFYRLTKFLQNKFQN